MLLNGYYNYNKESQKMCLGSNAAKPAPIVNPLMAFNNGNVLDPKNKTTTTAPEATDETSTTKNNTAPTRRLSSGLTIPNQTYSAKRRADTTARIGMPPRRSAQQIGTTYR